VTLTETAQQRDRARTIYEKSQTGRRAFTAPELDVPRREDLLPDRFRRTEPAQLPEIAEPEIVRHYNRLSKRNFDLDTGFYPLGSCTMKHNPKLHERVAALPGHARLHPLQHPKRAQGALRLMWELQRALGEVAGLPHVSLQPSAGSHGELAGVLLTRAYHQAHGEHGRTKVLTPDTAHGTNPATVTMAGLEVVKVGTNDRGGVDVEDLKAKAGDDVALLMLTNPNTLGLFDPAIEEIAHVVHDAGATLYYDGANLNAVMGRARPGDMGFDIVHFNLHKTFTQPHGGGGPGAGPIAVSDRIEPFLPKPQVVRHVSGNGAGPQFDLDFDRPQSIGRLRGFQGNFGVFVRSYAYILSLGSDGLQEASETAVLNANYLMARLAETAGEHLPPAYDRTCMHEFVLTGGPMKKALGIRTLDLAKRMLDFGYHPPTVYFPLLVDEALLIEPTETETRETLDAFAEVIGEILAEAAEDPEAARNAPYTTPVRRLDEAGAAKRPIIRQTLPS
jgi:glycine dehydrogenase subunit 2